MAITAGWGSGAAGTGVGTLSLAESPRPGSGATKTHCSGGSSSSGKADAWAWASLSFVCGIVIFSGSLYALVLSGAKLFGPITPLGGLLLTAAWAILGWNHLPGTTSPEPPRTQADKR